MTNGLGNVSGTIGTVVGLGITLGALGLALEFVDRSFDRATPRSSRSRKSKRKPLFDTSYGSGNGGIFNIPTKAKGKKSNKMYGDFF